MQKDGSTETQTEYIYALIDPRTDLPFYIGRSEQPSIRFYAHMSQKTATRRVWARVTEIRAEGLEPSLGILEETTDGRRAECEWVRRYLAQGIDLANCFRRNSYDPHKPPPTKPRTFKALTFRLPKSQYDHIREFAFKNEMTHQQILDEAVRRYLETKGIVLPEPPLSSRKS